MSTPEPAPAVKTIHPIPAPPEPSGYVTSAVRTLSPYLVGWVASWAVTLGLPVSMRATLSAALTFAIGSAYYLVVHAVQKKWPKVGWLLGSPAQPVYRPVTTTGSAAPTETAPPAPTPSA